MTEVPFESQVRLAVYDHFVTTGSAPTPATLAARVRASEADIHAALTSLHEAHMLVIQPDSGAIQMAHPFSGVPTTFRVEIGDRAWWANCIWDSFGIPKLLGRDARILTACPCCGEALTLRVTNSALTDQNAIIHFSVPAKHWWDDIVFT
ncbi:MAG: alkylmercury lyase family protein [Acidobacteriales bacterium]|nr:alkylmercury lyase family protein [Terriglobales bacterium]